MDVNFSCFCWIQIQLLEPRCQDCDAEEQMVVLRNSDWQFCKLVEHLDHAFLHGYSHQFAELLQAVFRAYEMYTVSGKQETKMFSVISPTKLGQL